MPRAIGPHVLILVGVLMLLRPTIAAAADDAAKIEAGEETYRTYCSPCHGDDLKNSGQTFDLRKLTASDRPRFEHSVRNGKKQMPPWKDVLSAEQIDQLWHYIRANAFTR